MKLADYAGHLRADLDGLDCFESAGRTDGLDDVTTAEWLRGDDRLGYGRPDFIELEPAGDRGEDQGHECQLLHAS
jgi:hypothetical protein